MIDCIIVYFPQPRLGTDYFQAYRIKKMIQIYQSEMLTKIFLRLWGSNEPQLLSTNVDNMEQGEPSLGTS